MIRNHCKFCNKNINGIYCKNCSCLTPIKKKKVKEDANENFTDYCYNQYQDSLLQKIYLSWLRFSIALFVKSDLFTKILNLLLRPLTGGRPNINFKKKERIIDVGCGKGDFIKLLPKDWEISGSEIVKYPNLPSSVIVGNFEKIKVKEKFSIVRSSHSLEHSLNPKRFLDKLMNITDKNGTLIILSPNSNSLSYKIFKRRWAALNIDSHFCILNEKCIKNYLKRRGFKVIYSKTYTIFQSVGSVMDFFDIKRFSFFFFILFSIILSPITLLEIVLNRGDSFVIYAKKK